MFYFSFYAVFDFCCYISILFFRSIDRGCLFQSITFFLHRRNQFFLLIRMIDLCIFLIFVGTPIISVERLTISEVLMRVGEKRPVLDNSSMNSLITDLTFAPSLRYCVLSVFIYLFFFFRLGRLSNTRINGRQFCLRRESR